MPYKAFQAVKPEHVNFAASAKLRFVGIFTSDDS
jgi:hypothetical protein